MKGCSDIYALAVSAYALQLANHDAKTEVLNRLNELAQSNGKRFDQI